MSSGQSQTLTPNKAEDATSPSTQNGGTTTTSAIIWDTFHNDPILDVVLKSSIDNVYFRASSHSLKRESSLFNGMFTTIPSIHMTANTAISLDYSAGAIRLFLDRYAVPIPIDYKPISFEALHEHRKLMSYLDVDRLAPPLAAAYNEACRLSPFNLLIAASRDNDLSNVKLALTTCGSGQPVKLDTTNIFDIVAQVRSTWRIPLLKCLLDDGRRQPGFHPTYYSGTLNHSTEQFRVAWPTASKADQFVHDVRLAELQNA